MKKRFVTAMLAAMLVVVVALGCARKKKEEQILTFSIAGEIRPSLDGVSLFSSKKRKRSEVLSDVSPFFKARDLVLADFAGGMELGCQPLARDRVFRWEPEWLLALSDANVRVLNLGDDHSLDCGREAQSQAMNYMLAQGFYIAGAGANQKEAHSPVYLTRNGVTISIVSFLLHDVPGIDPCKKCTGPSIYDRSAMISALQEMKKRASHRLVVLHWAERELPKFSDDELNIAREAIDFGADLVIGYGPRSAGGLHRIRGKWLIASMGRLVGGSAETQRKIADGLVISAEFTPDQLMNLRVSPVALESGEPRFLRGEEAIKSLQALQADAASDVQSNSTLIGDILYLK